ncbi:ATP-binding protein [uncultured Desulfosarcina sp.]|uniref:hybrid sensor histidine kinase/response regulator n=1 Tax=uncultured Desulfosarcina sp. TaxID=218289 RepID=UPI0029C67EC4|nr:ATP-binding protein [uncultured Desulfosarcina sp.]
MALKLNKRSWFYLSLLALCCLYWLADSVWSFVSFERNLNALIYTDPTSLVDTLLLRVSPYQVVSRLIVVALFLGSGALLFEFLTIKERAQAAFLESEKKYRALVNYANEAIFIAQDGVVKFPNPKAAELTGYPESELTGMPLATFLHPDDREMVMQRYRERLEGGSPPFKYSFRIINKQKRPIWVQIHTTRIDWDGRAASLNFLSDISEEKKLAEHLQRAERMETVGMLAGGVAHDLNNILSGLVSYPDLLLMDLPEDSPLRDPILTMQSSGKKAATIVQDLLTLSRRGIPGTEVVNLNTIVREYFNSPEMAKLQDFHPKVRIESQLDPDLLNVVGSPVHLSKALMNLVSNAAEACPDGGRVTVATRNHYMDKPVEGVETLQEGEFTVLEVRDTGEGIAPEDMKRIFEPFYTKKVMGRSGTGLGMAVVWGTVNDHQGHIDLKSSPEKGTTFTIYFPATRKILENRESAISIESLKGNGERILVVDDMEEQRRICSLLLSRLGYSVNTVSSGEDAVSYLAGQAVDLIVLDMIMTPGMDGLETYEKIIEIRPQQKALIVSGFSETRRVEKMQRLGAGAYIKKPYTLEKIGLAVKSELSRNDSKRSI